SLEFPSGRPISTKIEKVTKNGEEGEESVEEENTIPYEDAALEKVILNELPTFVYYSNYGNLSSKIYIPNVIKWLNGQTVEGVDINDEQVRTLRVLFDFVKLEPQEIFELGKDPKEMAIARNGGRAIAQPTSAEIKKAEDDKEERSILLQSASGDLTRK